MKSFILLIWLISGLAASELEPGPAFSDLRLRFQLTTIRQDSIDTHRLRLEVINVSKDPQQVEGYDRSADGQPFDSFAVYLTKADMRCMNRKQITQQIDPKIVIHQVACSWETDMGTGLSLVFMTDESYPSNPNTQVM